MNNQVDMQAFVGVDFDCEFFSSLFHRIQIDTLGEVSINDFAKKENMYRPKSYGDYPFCRPRLNKPQVVKDGQISWIPDGLVWNAFGENPDYNGGDSEFFNLERVSSQELRDVFAGYATWIECIGAEQDYTYWANAHGVPVVEVSK